MADILKVDYTNLTDTLIAISRQPFQLSSYVDGAGPLYVASSTVEEIGGNLYIVDGGNVQITDSGIPDGDAFIFLSEDGDGTASLFLSATNGSWDSQKSGIYSGPSKFIGQMVKDSGSYNDRSMFEKMYSPRIIGDIFVNGNIHTAGNSNADLGYKPKVSVNDVSAGNEGLVYTAFKDIVPNNGDNAICSGSMWDGSRPLVISRVERFDATTLYFYGQAHNGFLIYVASVASGGGGERRCSVSA